MALYGLYEFLSNGFIPYGLTDPLLTVLVTTLGRICCYGVAV
jgi:hypothetical protein